MDPEASIKKIRDEMEIALGMGSDQNRMASAIEALEAFEALDDWLSTGGFLPKDWKASR